MIAHPFWQTCRDQLGWALWQTVWQFLLVAVVVAILRRGLGTGRPAARYLLGVLGLLSFLLLPLASITSSGGPRLSTVDDSPAISSRPPTERLADESTASLSTGDASSALSRIPLPSEPDLIVESSAPAAGGVSRTWTDVRDWSRAGRNFWHWCDARVRPHLKLVTLGWCLGVMLFSLRPLSSWLEIRRLRHEASTAVPDQLVGLLEPLRRAMSVAREVGLALTERSEVPVVIGWLHPLILLPASMATGLTVAEVRAVLAHELAHVRRHDYLMNLVQVAVETLFFYHPAVWWLSRRVREDREEACDDLAISVLGDRGGYGRALLAVEQLRHGPEVLMLSARGGSLLTRIRRLVGRQESPPPWLLGCSLLGIAAVLGLTLVLTPRVEVVADEPPPGGRNQEQSKDEDGPAAATWTPTRLAAEIEAAWQRLKNVEYAATFVETRNANAFSSPEPLLVTGEGEVRYRSDGRRWWVNERSFTVNLGHADKVPQQSVAFFDGKTHVLVQDQQVRYGENSLANIRWNPASVFWRAGRSSSGLLTTLRANSKRIPRSEVISGYECVVVSTEWGASATKGTDEPAWRLEVAIAPEQSFLPLRSLLYLNGKLVAEERLSSLFRAAEGIWYPRRIESRNTGAGELLVRRELTVTEFRLNPAWVQPSLVPSHGYDVIDYRLARAWHQDPWWNELKPWLSGTLHWPRPGVDVSGPLKSYAKDAMEGAAAPPITAREWMQGDFKGWNHPDRKVTLLIFFGGDAVQPTPGWLALTRGLLEKYQPHGLDVLGVAAATASRETVADTIRSLEISFPVAWDSEGNESQPYGRTLATYGLSAYAGAVLVDHQGKVCLVDDAATERGDVETRLRALLIAAQPGVTLPALERDERLSNEQAKQIEAEWLRRVRAEPGTSRISGKVTAASGESIASAKLEWMPVLRLLYSKTPGGWLLLPDRDRRSSMVTNGAGEFVVEGLRYGSYQVTCSAPGLAPVDQVIHIGVEGEAVVRDFQLLQGDSIQGVVVDAIGQPISAATVRVTKRHPEPEVPLRHTTEHLPTVTQTTDPQGRFAWRELHQGAYSLEVTAPGFETKEIPLVPVGSNDLRVQLKKPGEPATSLMRRRETPAALTRRVRNFIENEKWSEIHALFSPELGTELSAEILRTEWRQLVQAGGKFRRFKNSRHHDGDPQWFDEDLHWESLQLTLSLLWNDAGQLVGWDWHHPLIDGTHGVELERRAAASGILQVTVVDAGAEVAKGATVELWREAAQAGTGEIDWLDETGSQWVRCRLPMAGPDFRFERLMPGRYRAVAQPSTGSGGRSGVSPAVEITAQGLSGECRVALQPGTDVLLRLVRQSDGSSLPDARVSLTRISGEAPRSNYALVSRNRPENAEWRHEQLSPGRYRVVAWQRAQSPDDPVWETSVADGTLEIKPGQAELRQDIRLVERPQTADEIRQVWPWIVEGTVRDQDGKPMEGVELRASSGMGSLRTTGTARTNAEGTYRLRIGRGIWFAHDEPDPFDAQVAVVFCSKPGYFEANLQRHGDFLAVNRRPRPDEKTLAEGQEDRLLVEGEPRRLDFVLTPAAEIVAKFRDEQDRPLARFDIDLHGDELPPAGSVLESIDADERGEVVIRDIPVGFAWWLSASTREPAVVDRGARFRLPSPGRYEMLLRRRSDEETKLHWLEFVSIVGPSRKDVRAEVLLPDAGVGPLLPAQRQREARELLQRVANSNGVWLRGPLPHIGTFSYQFERIGKPTQRLVVDPIDERRWPAVVGTAYRPGLARLVADSPSLAFRRFDERDGIAVIDYVVKPDAPVVRLEHGLGVAGSYGPYRSYSVREGSVAIDTATASPLWHVAGDRREEYSEFDVARDGSRVPRRLQIFEHERLLHDWRFSLIDSGLWLLREARDANGEVVVRVKLEERPTARSPGSKGS